MGDQERKTDVVTIGVLDQKLGDFLKLMQVAYAKTEESLTNLFGQKIAKLEKEVTVLREKNEELEGKVEALERQQKRKQITITNLRVKREEVPSTLEKAAKEAGAANINIRDVREIRQKSGGVKFVGELESFDEKKRLLKAKTKMQHNGERFFINDDLTKNEQLIQYKARRFAEATPGTTAVAYGKVYVNGAEYRYNKEKDTFLSQKN